MNHSSKKLNSCNYVSLNNYSSHMLSKDTNVMKGSDGVSKHYQVIPCVKSMSYDALTHGVQNSNSGYFDVNDAYKNNGDCNQKYLKRMCN